MNGNRRLEVKTHLQVVFVCTEPRLYQLRAYVYQARDLLAGDASGLSGNSLSLSLSLSSSALRSAGVDRWEANLQLRINKLKKNN